MDLLDFSLDYSKDFNPEIYNETYIGGSTSNVSEETKHLLDFLNEVFVDGNIKGKRLLDVGTGPTFHTVIAASKHFDEIYLSDFCQQNLDVLHEWWTGKVTLLEPIINYCLQLEKNRQVLAERNSEIRQKVKGILSIDLHKTNPLGSNHLASFDAIISGFCLESASSNRKEYEKALSNITSLLKKHGKLVILGALDQTFYAVGKAKFRIATLSEHDIRQIYTKIGFEVEQLKIFNHEISPNLCDGADYVMVAKKLFA